VETQINGIKKIKKITFIEPAASGWHIYSSQKIPRLGLPILGALMKERGCDVTIYVEDISPIDFEDALSSDLIGISCTSSTAPKGYSIAKYFEDNGVPVVMGGFHPTFMTEESLNYCSYVVRGEGEKALPGLVEAMEGKKAFEEVMGLSFKKDGTIVNNPDEEMMSCLEEAPMPDFSLIKGYEKIGVFPLSTSRGCPYNCSFCTVTNFYGNQYRLNSIDNVIREFKNIKADYVFICDDNFAADRKRTKELLRRKIEEGIGTMWGAQMRIETADDTELLELMKQSNCSKVYVGFESVNPEALKAFNKKLDITAVRRQIKQFHKYGIKIHGMFVLGADSDNKGTIKDTLKFSRKMHIDTIQFMVLTPIPGSKVFDDLKNEGRIFSYDWNLYDGNHVVFKPVRMTPIELQIGILKATKRFYSYWSIVKRFAKFDFFTMIGRTQGHRIYRKWMKENKIFLEKIKEGIFEKYDSFRETALNIKEYSIRTNTEIKKKIKGRKSDFGKA